jgi:hypothetical protein
MPLARDFIDRRNYIYAHSSGALLPPFKSQDQKEAHEESEHQKN